MPRRTCKGRVVFLVHVKPGSGAAFLAAYERIRCDVASVPGHIVDQVCRLRDDDNAWLITSEWQSLDAFLTWEHSEAHRELAKPLRECIASAQSLKFDVIEETRLPRAAATTGADADERGVWKWFDAA